MSPHATEKCKNTGDLPQRNKYWEFTAKQQCDTVVITLNICKICVYNHKSYIVYRKLCKVHLITFAYSENVHMSHLFIMFSQVQGRKSMYFNFIPVCGMYIWEISQLALIPVKILVTHWQICGLQLKF